MEWKAKSWRGAMNRLFERRGADRSRIGGELAGVEVGPHGGVGVEGALDVVGLVGEHLADADDQVDEAFAGGPVVADADVAGVDVGVVGGGERFASRRD